MDTTKYRTQIPVKKDGIFAYEIYLEKDFGMLAERLKVCKPENRRLCIVTDSTVDQYYGFLHPVQRKLPALFFAQEKKTKISILCRICMSI